MYVRFALEEKEENGVKTTFKHSIKFTNNIVANTAGYFSKQSQTNSAPTFSNNNYYNAANAGTIELTVEGVTQIVVKDGGKTLDPKFKDADKGDFTVTNENVKINKVGAPRWL